MQHDASAMQQPGLAAKGFLEPTRLAFVEGRETSVLMLLGGVAAMPESAMPRRYRPSHHAWVSVEVKSGGFDYDAGVDWSEVRRIA